MSKTRKWIFAACAVVFFFGAMILPRHGDIYISPDETANAFFANQFAQTASLSAPSSMNASFDNAIHPRSTVVKNGTLLPGSFLGLPVLYGTISAVTNHRVLGILTPLIVIATAWLFFGLMREWFDREIAFVSTLLFLFHPAIWYYSARGLMHNVLFVCLLLLALYFFFVKAHRKFLLGGLFIGLALFVRTSELLWVLPSMLVTSLVFVKRWKSSAVIRTLVGLLIVVATMGLLHYLTYGSPIETGYTVESTVDAGEVIEETSTGLLPFGLDVRTAKEHFRNYGFALFWWLSILAIIGKSIFLHRAKRSQRFGRIFFWFVGMAVSLWLILLYGSWVFFDNPDPTQITIANSYVRYWLPLYIFSIPFVAHGILWLAGHTRRENLRVPIIAFSMIVIFFLNLDITFFAGQDGLIRVSEMLKQSKTIRADVINQTPDSAIVIVDRSDKLFFPYRQVMYPLRDDRTYTLMPRIAAEHPLYYYGITLPEEDMQYLNQRRLKDLGLAIERVESYDQESLYQIFQP